MSGGLTFSDGAAFVGGGLWLPPRLDFPAPAIIRSRLLVFHDSISRARRPRFIQGLVAAKDGRVSDFYVEINPRMVSRATLHEAEGQLGFLLHGPDGVPCAWVPSRAWLEAVRR